MRRVFVRFLEEIEDTKKHLEINWPLLGNLKYSVSASNFEIKDLIEKLLPNYTENIKTNELETPKYHNF